jgi:hypothetical protein
MIYIFIETEVFVVGSKAVYVIFVDINNTVNEWSSAGEMIYSFEILFL